MSRGLGLTGGGTVVRDGGRPDRLLHAGREQRDGGGPDGRGSDELPHK
jgi:hypothetical protein